MSLVPFPSAGMPCAAILCGGLGTRLRPAVADRPKALANVAGRPFLAWLLDQLDRHGFSRVVLCTGHGAHQIEAEFGSRYKGLSVEYSIEPAPLGTGGAIRNALPLLGSELTLIANGDSYLDANLEEFCREHAEAKAAASMLLTRVSDAGRFGSVDLDARGLVTGFREKAASAGPAWINAGIYLIRSELLDAIPPNTACSLERDVFPAWIKRGLRGATTCGRFIDIGTPESYAAAADFFQPPAISAPLLSRS